VRGPTTFGIQAVVSNVPEPPPGRQPVSRVWHVSAIDAAGQAVSVLGKPFRVVVHYRAATPQFVAFWDGQEWVNLDTTIDRAAHTAAASTSQLSQLVALGPPLASGSPAPVPAWRLPIVPIVVASIAVIGVAVTTYLVRTRLAPPEEAQGSRLSNETQPRPQQGEVVGATPSAPQDGKLGRRRRPRTR
jgi:hypothetical protein